MTSEDQSAALAREPVGRLLFRYSLPAILGVIADALNTLIDTIMIGQGIGAYALGAMAIVFPVHTIFLGFSLCIGIGAASIISRALGEGRPERAARAAGNAVFLSLAVSLLALVTGLFALEPLVRLFGAEGVLTPLSQAYLSVYLCGFVFLSLASVGNQILRAYGRPALSMAVVIVSASLNIVLDALFIFVLHMGIGGAALATVLAAVCAATFAVLAGSRSLGNLRPHRRDLLPDVGIMRETIALGSSILLRLFSASVFNGLVNHVVLGYGGPLHLAVLNMIYRWMVFFSLPVYGISQGVQPIVGYNFGARQFGRVKAAVQTGLMASFVVSLLLYAVMMLFPEALLSLFNGQADVVRTGVPTMRVIILFFPVWGFIYLGIGLFQAIGKAWPALLLGVSQQVAGLVLVLLLPLHYGLSGVWLAYPLADVSAFIIVCVAVIISVRSVRRLMPAMAKA